MAVALPSHPSGVEVQAVEAEPTGQLGAVQEQVFLVGDVEDAELVAVLVVAVGYEELWGE